MRSFSVLSIVSLTMLSGSAMATPQQDSPPVAPAEEASPAPAALTAPPAPGKGAIVGVLSNAEDGEPTLDGFIGVVGSSTAVVTDLDGVYRLELSPGRYTLQFAADLRKPLRSQTIVVVAGQILRLDSTMELEDQAAEPAVETVVELEASSTQSILLNRQRSASSGDAVGRAEITKANDKNAAEAAKRVVGAHVEGSRFLFVRGLGERYTNALLDGFRLPSPEPDRQAVPLDLFPSQILESLVVTKTFTPDMPGDFAGGSMRISTRRIPDSLVISGSLSTSFNTNATFANNLSHPGGDLDFLGFDDGARSLGDDIPEVKIDNGLPDGKGGIFSNEQVREIGKGLNTPLGAGRALGAPNFSGNFVAANSFDVGDLGKLGVLGALVYDRRLERIVDGKIRTFSGQDESGTLKSANDLDWERSTTYVSWGAMTGLTLEFNEHHSVSLTGLYSRAADIGTSSIIGYHEERDAEIADTRLSFVARQLAFGSIGAKHEIPEANGLKVEYGIGLARAMREQPDFRGAVYQRSQDQEGKTSWSFEDDSSSGLHFFSDQGETSVSAKLDLTLPVTQDREQLTLGAGAMVDVRERAFQARRLRFRAPNGVSCLGSAYDSGCPDGVFDDDARLDSGELDLEENTRQNDGYDASLSVVGTYVMVDTRPTKTLRVTLGPRVEVSSQSISPFNPVARDERAEQLGFREFDEVRVLPAALLTYSPLEATNLRLSVTRTIARPQLRELAPFQFADFFGGREVRGNPDLVNTSIINADSRFEFFPKASEVLAVTAFFKHFDDPIEQVIDPSSGSGIVGYVNADSANLFGVEFEVRKSLDFIVPELGPLSIITNVTLAQSRVGLGDAAQNLSSQSRPLSLQAPYVINAALDFDYEQTATRARLQYNVVGARIHQVGTRGLPDMYEQPRHLLDVTVGQGIGSHVEIRASATNIIDSPVRREHQYEGPEAVTEEYRTGQSFSLGIGLSY